MTKLSTAVAALGLACLAIPGHARSRDSLGTLTFFDADGKTGHDVEIQSLFFMVPPALAPAPTPAPTPVPAADTPSRRGEIDDQRSITVTAAVPVPDPALLTWIRDQDHARRRVVVKLNDGTDDVAHVSTLESPAGQLVNMTMGYSGPGGGTQTLTVQVDHLSINGAPAF